MRRWSQPHSDIQAVLIQAALIQAVVPDDADELAVHA